MPNYSASGTPSWLSTDAFLPPTQAKDLVDAEAEFNYFIAVDDDSDRTSLASPKLRDGLFCYVRATDRLWEYDGSSWVSGVYSNLQLDTTNSIIKASTQFGIGKITGVASANISEVVTFPVAFASAPAINVNFYGARTPVGSFNPVGLGGATLLEVASMHSPSTTGFTAVIQTVNSSALSTARDYYYSWSATGVLA